MKTAYWRGLVVGALLGLLICDAFNKYEILKLRAQVRYLTVHEDCFYTNQMNLNKILVNR